MLLRKLAFLYFIATVAGLGCADASTEDPQTDASGTITDTQTLNSTTDHTADSTADDTTTTSIVLPPQGGQFDYQLGGAYAPPAGVTIVGRDRNDPPAPGIYSICYINGFQTQPDEADFWLSYPDAILRDKNGKPVGDPDWPGEMILDIRLPKLREQLAAIVGTWIEGCAAAGFQAIEIDNLDTYERFANKGLLESHAVETLAMYSEKAHALGLAIGQKNSVELAARRNELHTDFAVTEECSGYYADEDNDILECDSYIAAYGPHVLMIEYDDASFRKGCERYASWPLIKRDLDLVPAGNKGYVYQTCAGR